MEKKKKIFASSFSSLILLFCVTLLLISSFNGFFQLAEAGKRRIEISDDLDDVDDNEEDDTWKEWGKKYPTPEFDPPPDFTNMDFEQIQAEMAKRTFGPVVGFVKLRLGVRRTKDMVVDIAMRWSKVLRTGGIGARFSAVDRTTLMFNMETGKEVNELREFVLSQEEAYELKIGKQEFRRLGDPPLEEVVDKLHAEESKKKEEADRNEDELNKDEL